VEVSRYRRRPSGHKDQNHDAVVRELRQLGATVLETHALGDDAPDLVVGWRGVTALVELKSADKVLGRQHQTVRLKRERLERQRAYLEAWAGGLAFIAETTEQVLERLHAASVREPRFVPGDVAPQGSSWNPLALLLRPVVSSSAPPDTPGRTRRHPPATRGVGPAAAAPASAPATPES
jgi:hypothetical protein